MSQSKEKKSRKDRFRTVDKQTEDVKDTTLQNEILTNARPENYVAEEVEDLLQREIISNKEFDRLQTLNLSHDENPDMYTHSELNAFLANDLHCELSSDLEKGNRRSDNLHRPSNVKLKRSSLSENSFEPQFEFNESGLPVNWTSNLEGGASCLHDLVTLKPGEEEYDSIQQELEDAGLIVINIERLENVYLLNRFKNESEDIKKHRNRDFKLNVRYLYHGTKVDKRRICEEGLDQRLSRMGFFGKGIYFSDNPLKCVHYANDNRNFEESYLLKCRVILGESKHFQKGEHDTSLRREPEKPPGVIGWRFYDSVVGCPKDYNEFVIYENRRALIEYIITFTVDRTGDEALRHRSPSLYSIENGLQQDDTAEFQEITCTQSWELQQLNDPHCEKIQSIRETIRRKRCMERGEEYIPPDEEKLKHDREIWRKLQCLHEGPQSASNTVVNKSKENSTAKKETVKKRSNQEADSIDPVHEVLDSLVSDFLVVTATDNVEAAKYYIERSQMDVDRAITLYFEEML